MNILLGRAQQLYHHLVSEKIRWQISVKLTKFKYSAITKKAARYLLRSKDKEFQEVGRFLLQHGATMFPYDYTFKYKPEDVPVHWDEATGLHYTILNGKRLYGKRGMLPSKIKSMINSLLVEQDPLSPHLYVDEQFTFNKDSVLYDVGAAEGIFTLLNIEKVKKAYLFEVDPAWIEALQKTFEPWQDKIEIINKFVGKTDDADHISLDVFSLTHLLPDFIKADIEGSEADLLLGAKKLLDQERPLKAAVCTYHYQEDADKLSTMLTNYRFQTAFTNGYLFGYVVPLQEPYLRKAVVRAWK